MAALAAAGCGKSAPPSEAATGRVVTVEDGDHVHLVGKGVPFPDLKPELMLPFTGDGTYDVDLEIPVVNGRRDYSRARGYFTATCSHCAIGDDKTNLVPRTTSTSRNQIIGEGLLFGHVAFDNIEIRVDVGGGHARLTRWDVTSPDLVTRVAADVKLARDLADSTVEACVRFQPTKALQQRDPKTYAVFEVTGASPGADGMFSIRFLDKLQDPRILAMDCDPAKTP